MNRKQPPVFSDGRHIFFKKSPEEVDSFLLLWLNNNRWGEQRRLPLYARIEPILWIVSPAGPATSKWNCPTRPPAKADGPLWVHSPFWARVCLLPSAPRRGSGVDPAYVTAAAIGCRRQPVPQRQDLLGVLPRPRGFFCAFQRFFNRHQCFFSRKGLTSVRQRDIIQLYFMKLIMLRASSFIKYIFYYRETIYRYAG